MERDGIVSIVYEICHVTGQHHPQGLEEFQKMLGPYLTPGKGRIEVSNRLSALTITDTKENVGFVEKMLQLIHTADAPIMIEAKVVELRWDKDLQIGFEGDLSAAATAWTVRPGSEAALRDIRLRYQPSAMLTPTPFQGSTFRFNSVSSHRGTLGGLIHLFIERGHAQILSQPRILVKANEKAQVFAGEEVAIPTSFVIQPGGPVTTFAYKKAGITLDVTPHIAAPGKVSLKMKPEVTNTFGFTQLSPGVLAPSFNVRSVETELLVRDGEEVVIGGLFRREKQTIRRGIPFLSDIPILGYLFSKNEDTEVVQEVLFFIKPAIIKSDAEMPRGVVVPEK